MGNMRAASDDERPAILAIINAAAEAYRTSGEERFEDCAHLDRMGLTLIRYW